MNSHLAHSCDFCGGPILNKETYSHKQRIETRFCGHACWGKNRRKIYDSNREEKFFSKVSVTSYCHEWIGPKDEKGYGMFTLNRRTIKAHRAAVFFSTGNLVPESLQTCHKCDNPSCVNPNHLFIGTAKDNCQDKINKGRAVNVYGELSGTALLKDSDIPQIIKDKRSAVELSKIYGVSASTIRAVRQRKTWRHINA